MHWFYSLVILAGLSACQFTDETISGQVEKTDVWILETFGEQPVSTRITLQFPEEGRLSGQAPCNTYFAQQKAPLPWFEAGPIGATKRACPELKLEYDYFNALTQASLIEVSGETLILANDNGPILVFRKES